MSLGPILGEGGRGRQCQGWGSLCLGRQVGPSAGPAPTSSLPSGSRRLPGEAAQERSRFGEEQVPNLGTFICLFSPSSKGLQFESRPI